MNDEKLDGETNSEEKKSKNAGGEEQTGTFGLPADLESTLDTGASGGAGGTSAERKTIGPYVLLKKLGEGGMGQVWLAEQTVPVTRKVALKLIRGGMYDDAVVQRFESERQSLAVMNHPAIAKVFDAGSTKDGQPYFAMEYVDGQTIARYCDSKKLKIRERLELFIKVCEGVQHAHQKAIIHRDLKPSNILVVEVDEKATPRIIDFGIAKAITSQANAEETMFTRAGALVGTPGYMSPEQADSTVVDVDTRTDVYSLGVVLYQLLTGLLPFDEEGGTRKSIQEMLRQLREDDPPSPSTKVNTEKKTGTAVAESRGTEPKHLVKELRGDLDWITMKALEKDRARRYESASELAADIRRYLGNEPVLARPASSVYRLKKYVQRHRVGVAMAGVIAALLVASAVAQTVQLRRVTRERDRANRITDFMTRMFAVSQPSEARGNTVTAREILDQASSGVEHELTQDPQLQAQMMATMATVYGGLGLYTRAESLVTRSMEIRSRILGPEDPDTLSAKSDLGIFLYDEGRYPEAEKLQRELLEERRRVLGPEDEYTLGTILNIAILLDREGHYAEAEKLDRETLATCERVLPPGDRLIIYFRNNLPATLEHQGRYAEAEKFVRETLEVRRRTLGPDHPDTISSMYGLANLLQYQAHYAEAEKVQRETLALDRKVLGPEHSATIATLDALGLTLEREGQDAEAEKVILEALELRRRVFGAENAETLSTINNLGILYEHEGRYAESEKIHREMLEVRTRVLGPDHPETLMSALNLAGVLEREGKFAEAEKVGVETLEVQRRKLGPEHPDTLAAMTNLGVTYLDEHKYAEAEKLQREALALNQKVLGPDHPNTGATWYNLGCLLAREGKRAEALATLRQSVDHGLTPMVIAGIEQDTDLVSLHGDPRFAAFVKYAKAHAAAAQKRN